MNTRYAIYYAPAQHSPWWNFGAHWLGRDEFQNSVLPQTTVADLHADELARITAHPRRYGFHGTLKAPFGLTDTASASALQTRLQALAHTLKPVALGPMQAIDLGGFAALVPVHAPDALAALATACVTGLDDLRRPLNAQDLARRNADTLDARGLELLQQFGYPQVLERYRFHMSLTGPVAPACAQQVVQAVEAQVAHLSASAPLVLDRLCLFMEPASGQAFVRVMDVELQP